MIIVRPWWQTCTTPESLDLATGVLTEGETTCRRTGLKDAIVFTYKYNMREWRKR